MRSTIEKLLKLPRDQQVRTGLRFLFSFAMTGASVGVRSDADSVFLARIGIERLPAMILVSASGVAIVTALYARTLARHSLQRVIFGTHLLFAMATSTLPLSERCKRGRCYWRFWLVRSRVWRRLVRRERRAADLVFASLVRIWSWDSGCSASQ